MSSMTPAPTVTGRLDLADFALRVFLVAHLLLASSLISLGGGAAFRGCLLLLAFLSILGIGLSLWRGYLVSAAFSTSILAMVALQMYVFSFKAYVGINWNVMFSYIPLASFALFSASRKNLYKNARFFFYVSVGYCLIYVLFGGLIIQFGVIDPLSPADSYGPKVLVDDLRGARLLFSGAHGASVAFAAWSMFRNPGSSGRLFPLAYLVVALLAIYASGSRVLIAFFFLLFVINVLVGSKKIKANVLFSMFLIGFLINIAGVFAIDWNIFQYIAADPSGFARARFYALLSNAIQHDPVFGVGLPPDVASYFAYFTQPYVFWEDFGTLGVWATFGLFGLAIYTAMAAMATLSPARQVEGNDPYVKGILMAAALFGIFSTFQPDMLTGSGMNLVWFAVLIVTAKREPKPAGSSQPALDR